MLINGDKIVAGNTQSPANVFVFCGNLIAATTTAVGGVLKLQNTWGIDLIIKELILDVTTGSTGVATLDIGVDDGGDVSSDLLIDGIDAQGTGVKDNKLDAGTNGGMAVWKDDEYVVATASATVAGLVGTYKIIAIAR